MSYITTGKSDTHIDGGRKVQIRVGEVESLGGDSDMGKVGWCGAVE